MKSNLHFSENGTFRVLQLADTQQAAKVSLDTVRLIDALVRATRPDLVVYTGDQLKGYSPSYRRDTRRRVAETLLKITGPVRRRGIPFAVTFGNHDTQAGLTREAQYALYTRLSGCLMPAGGPDPGTFQLTVRDATGRRDGMAIYLVDSGDSLRDKYFPVRPEQTKWLQDRQRALCAQNGRVVPAMVFQHIPVPEIYRLLVPVSCRQSRAVCGIGRHAGCLALNQSLCRPGGVLAEAPGVPTKNSGEFKALTQTEGIFAMFFGHDHRNSFSGRVDGIELGYTPSCGFDAYGAGVNRGGRLFVFHEDDPANFDTRVYSYRELVGSRPVRPLRNLIDSVIPANMDEAWRMVFGLAAGAIALGAAASAAIRAAKKSRR